MKALITTLAGTALIAGLLGYGLGWKTGQPTPAKWAMTSAPSVRLREGGLLAERRYDPEAKPSHRLPAGSKAARILSGVVTPRTSGDDPQGKESPRPVTVELTITQEKDGSQRAVMSSPDGPVTNGSDTWVIPPVVPRLPKWTASALAGFDAHQMRPVYGAMVSRGAGPFVVQGGFIGQMAFVGVGVRW